MPTATLNKTSHETPTVSGGGNTIYPPYRELSQEGDDDHNYVAALQMLSHVAVKGEDFNFIDIIARNYTPKELETVMAAGSTALSQEISAQDFPRVES